MLKTYFPIILLLMFSHYNANAQDSLIDSELSKCMETNQSTHGTIQCIDIAYGKWDKELNDWYNKLLDVLDDKSDDNLKEAQRKWIEYRDLEFKNIESIYSNKEGTMYLPMLALDKMEIVKKRAAELKGYYNIITEY